MEDDGAPPSPEGVLNGAYRILTGIAGVRTSSSASSRTRAGGHQTLVTVRVKADKRVVVEAVGEQGPPLHPVTASPAPKHGVKLSLVALERSIPKATRR